MKRLAILLLGLFAYLGIIAPTTVTKPTHITINPAAGGPCPVTVGTLTLSATVSRTSGASPLLVFYNATATTDSSITGGRTAFQDVTYTWNFGDGGTSGTTNWLYGSNPNGNSKNNATGAVASHLYITQGSDTSYSATVTAQDQAGNTASCTVGSPTSVVAFDPSGTNGWPGAATTCYSSSGNFTSCPSGAAHTTVSTFAAVNGTLTNKRLLYRCGETFTGDNAQLSGTKASVGAYGGCEGTQTSQPIFDDTVATNPQIEILAGAGDIRISDIFFNGHNTGGSFRCAVLNRTFITQNVPYQVTLWNLQETGDTCSYVWAVGAQWGAVQVVAQTCTGICAYINQNENNPTQVLGSGLTSIAYQAFMGGFLNGVGAAGGAGGIEVLRVSACRLCTINNNTIENASNGGGVLKIHNGNTYQSCGNTIGSCPVPCTVGATFVNISCWTGIYTELLVISDNLITGNSSAILSDVAPQNGGVDERLRNIVIERNVYNSTTNACCESLLYASGANFTIRDNGFYMPANGSIFPIYGLIMAQRGTGNCTSSCFTVQLNEAYNNSCFAPSSPASGNPRTCVGYDAFASSAATINSFASNNLFYITGTTTGAVTVRDTGGNTVSNNTGTVTNNPGFTNGSGAFTKITDFKPTANFSGGTSVPVVFDCVGTAWSPTWDLGACHH